ncbi:hypothetical protein BU23DRAFT_158446 [Bimuria novae-zelandiae CBS 107.79]|uniref:Uncharacterized protein n=1 Tax=Bimuria novae-zelandiae CBS 107.79 TaxID=1447943 RepID=A0A6A5V6T5_9PLEO|nr:hypothetical protein BU23DRAFT_158446 [Bimuria novae-zelandiae CBS 107.79]
MRDLLTKGTPYFISPGTLSSRLCSAREDPRGPLSGAGIFMSPPAVAAEIKWVHR